MVSHGPSLLTCLETALCRGAQSRAKFGPVVWRDNLHFKMRNTNIASPLLGPLRGPEQWSVMDHCFLSRFETILANYRPQKWLIVRPFPPRMVPHLGPWRGADIVAQFGPCVWRDNVHFGPQKHCLYCTPAAANVVHYLPSSSSYGPTLWVVQTGGQTSTPWFGYVGRQPPFWTPKHCH